MAKVYDVVSHGGTYQKDGQEKVRWINHGAVFEKDGRLSMKLDSIPIQSGDNAGWFKLFEVTPRNQRSGSTQNAGQATGLAPQGSPELDDEIPF